jgi:hypothetical protein
MDDWRKSSYSNNGATCVEVASAEGVMVRDTTNRDGGTLILTVDAWRAFTGATKQDLGRDKAPNPRLELSSSRGPVLVVHCHRAHPPTAGKFDLMNANAYAATPCSDRTWDQPS